MRKLIVAVLAVGPIACTNSSSPEGAAPDTGVSMLDAGAPEVGDARVSLMDAGALDGAAPDAGAADGGARVSDDGSCVAPPNTSNVVANRCPITDPCPDCTRSGLPDGLYFQLTTLPVALSACGSCQTHGTLRVEGGVFDLITEESADICTGYVAQQTRVHGSYTIEGELLRVADRCGAATLAWTARSSDTGMVRLTPAGEVDAGSMGSGLVFQRQ